MGIPTGYGAIAPISGEVKDAEKFKDLTSLKIRTALPDVVVGIDDTVKVAIDKCVSLDSQGIAEIGIILFIVYISFNLTGGSAYVPNPVSYHISSMASL